MECPGATGEGDEAGDKNLNGKMGRKHLPGGFPGPSVWEEGVLPFQRVFLANGNVGRGLLPSLALPSCAFKAGVHGMESIINLVNDRACQVRDAHPPLTL